MSLRLDSIRLRQGRKVGRTLYIQSGPEPSDDDQLVGVMDTWELAELVVQAVNKRNRIRVAGRPV